MSPFHAQTAGPISTKFCTDLPANSGKALNTSMTPPIQPLDSGVPQTPKPKRVTGEKTLCNLKCPDEWRNLIKFFPGSARARLASIYIYFLLQERTRSDVVELRRKLDDSQAALHELGRENQSIQVWPFKMTKIHFQSLNSIYRLSWQNKAIESGLMIQRWQGK